MILKSLRDSTIHELNGTATAFVAACGYESRSAEFSKKLGSNITDRTAICFNEWSESLSRETNLNIFKSKGFSLEHASGSDADRVGQVVRNVMNRGSGPLSLAFDISSMTRAWHGAIVRALRTAERESDIHTFFAYVPATFSNPPKISPDNEIVAPVQGFASLTPPDLPIAAIIGLGYERERALGLQQLLDPARTVLLVPRFRTRVDKFYPQVLKSNHDILERTSRDWVFDYWVDEPSAAFGTIASIISGLTGSFRIVLASLGPKIFGIVCFLLATRFPQASVWRTSSGIHGKPRQSNPDIRNTVIFDVGWSPTHQGDSSTPTPP